MGGFTVFTRRRSETAQQTQGGDLPEAVRQMLPMRFEAVGEALASGGDVAAACSVVGGDVKRRTTTGSAGACRPRPRSTAAPSSVSAS